MKGIAIDMTSFPCRILWDTDVTGVSRLTQNVATTYCTDVGSDIVVARGNELSDTMKSGGMFDATAAQHAVNFAVLDTVDFLRTLPESTPEETLGAFSARIVGKTNNRLAVNLFVTNAAGEGVGTTTTIPL